MIANDVNNDPSARQYNIVDLNGGNPRSAAFTGANCFADFIHITGPNYAIAGNILISKDVVQDMETAFLNTSGTLAQKLMAALQGAKRPGADVRCLSDGISSASAFIRVADPDDTDSSYGNLSLDINVWISAEIFEPIDALQDAFDMTVSLEELVEKNQISIYPSPSNNLVNIRSQGTMFNTFEVVNLAGQMLAQSRISNPQNHLYLDVNGYVPGIYFLNLYLDGKKIGSERFLVTR